MKRWLGMRGFRCANAFLLTVFLATFFFSAPVQAAYAREETIKVGYMGAGGVQELEDGSYTGYVVDYLNEIAEYTGWKYEYVYGAWSEIVGMLESGELDLVGLVRHAEEREETLLYSDLSMAHDYTALCATEDSGLYYQDYGAFNGRRVGVVADTFHESALVSYAQEHDFSYELVYFPTIPDAEQALLDGEIDLLATSGISSSPAFKQVDRFQLERTYFVTGVQNQALMDELNAAVQCARIDNPTLEYDLTQTYFDVNNVTTDLHLTKEEQTYLETVGPVTVMGFDGRRPLGYVDGNGDFVGVLSDYLDILGESSGLTFVHEKAEITSLAGNAENMVEKGCAILFIDQDLEALGLEGILCKSDPLFETGLSYIKRRDNAGNTGRGDLVFSINKEMSYLEEMLLAESSDYTIIWCDDSIASMEAVVNGRADITIQDEHVAAYLLQKPLFAETLREVVGWQLVDGMCLYAPVEHAHLINILNKTMDSMTEIQRLNAVTDAMIAHSYEYGLEDILYEHGKILLIVLVLIVLVVVLGFLLFMRLKTLRRKQTENMELQERVERDELTGVYNRTCFFEKAKELIDASGDDICIIRLNVCHFKVLNELHGSDKGDRLLCEMGKDLRALGEQLGVVVGRFSADQFYLCGRKDALDKIELPRRSPAPWLGMDITLTYGVYPVGDQKDIPVSVMCDRANMANVSIRSSATEHIGYYNDEARNRFFQEQEIEQEMENALKERAFCIHIQPKYDVKTEAITGGEALVRWQHPEKGLIPPGKFIGLFERNGFIMQLDYYVWEECCRFQAEAKAKGHPIYPLSMNISRIHFYGSELVEKLEMLLRKYSVDAADFELEITESVYSEDPEIIFDKCEQLRDMGFKIAMDDFGSGFSSLNMLKEMPLDIIKMDLRFLSNEKDAVQKEKGHSILHTLISLAHTLELGVVVEGLETAEQRDFICEIGNCVAQGYYYSKPVDSSSYEKMLNAQRA